METKVPAPDWIKEDAAVQARDEGWKPRSVRGGAQSLICWRPMIETAHIGELWRRFNAAGGTPVLTAFGGVIVTGVTGYLLQERRSEIEDRRLQRDSKRLRGEELYHLFDDWLVGIRKSAENLVWKIQTRDHTLNDIELAYGEQQAYRRIIMLANIDFPSMKDHLEKLGKEYVAYTNVLATIGAEPKEDVVVPPIQKFIEVLSSTGDRFQTALIRRIKELYD